MLGVQARELENKTEESDGTPFKSERAGMAGETALCGQERNISTWELQEFFKGFPRVSALII